MPDLVVVLVLALVVVLVQRGPKTLPRLGEALGRGVRAAREEARRDAAGRDAADREPSGGTESAGSEAPKGKE